MKLDNVYFCVVGVIYKNELDNNFNFNIEGNYVKCTLVYRDQYSRWHDLFTNEIYKEKNISAMVGDLYIDFEIGLKLFIDVINTDKKNMSKIRIKNILINE